MSLRINSPCTFDLISNAASCAQVLQREANSSVATETNLNLALGAAYCLGHHLTPPVRIHNLVPDILESTGNTSVDLRAKWMASQVEFSRLRSSITGLTLDTDDTGHAQNLLAELESWRERLPSRYSDINQSEPRNLASDSRKLWLFCEYHEARLRAKIMVNGGSTCFDSQLVLAATKVIIEATSTLPTAVVLCVR